MIENCKYCNSTNLVVVKKNEDRYGLYCKDCGKWLKWIRKQEVDLYKQELSNNNSDEDKIRKFVNSLSEKEIKKLLAIIADKLQ